MKMKKKYNVVNKSSGSKNPISTLLQEAAKKWAKKQNARDRSHIMKAIAVECATHQAESTKDQFTVRDNYRAFLASIDHPQTKTLVQETVKKFNHNDPEKSAKTCLPNLKKAVARVTAEKDTAKPVDLLDKVLEEINAIHRAITTSTGAKEKLRKLSANKDDLDKVIIIANKIESQLKAFSKLKPVRSKNQKRKPKLKKSKKKTKSKPKKRVSARTKSRR